MNIRIKRENTWRRGLAKESELEQVIRGTRGNEKVLRSMDIKLQRFVELLRVKHKQD